MRTEINENELENIIGGKIECTYIDGAGTIWITAKNPKVYSFTNYSVVTKARSMVNEGYSDQEIIDYLKEKNAIW